MKQHFILSDRWLLARGKRRRQLAAQLALMTNIDFEDRRYQIEILTNLSFYPGAQLLRIRLDDLSPPTFVPYWLRLKDGNWQSLDGRWAIIEAINAMCPLRLDSNNGLDYLEFVSFFLRSSHEPGVILEQSNCDLLDLRADDITQCFGSTVFPNLVPEASGREKLTFDVPYTLGGKLYFGRFQTQLADGRIQILSAKEIPFRPLLLPRGLLTATLAEPEALPSTAVEESDRIGRIVSIPSLLTDVNDAVFPTAKILEGITPADNEADQALIDTYRPLLEPVPLQMVPNDLRVITDSLNERYPWCKAVTERIVKSLIVSAHGDCAIRLPPLLLVGAPGTGKTSYAFDLAQALEIPYQVINIAGKSDPRDLLGTSRGYGTRQPGLILRLMLKHRIANGLCLLDELDKAGTGKDNGAVVDALLTFLEPSSAKSVWDECLGGGANLSFWQWIATANTVAPIPSPLLSRFSIIEVPRPQREHYPAIVANTVAEFTRKHRIDPRLIPLLEPADWRWLEGAYQNPRHCRRATEWLLSHWLAHPKPAMRVH
jgi:hypothetical protein